MKKIRRVVLLVPLAFAGCGGNFSPGECIAINPKAKHWETSGWPSLILEVGVDSYQVKTMDGDGFVFNNSVSRYRDYLYSRVPCPTEFVSKPKKK